VGKDAPRIAFPKYVEFRCSEAFITLQKSNEKGPQVFGGALITDMEVRVISCEREAHPSWGLYKQKVRVPCPRKLVVQ
jgi:hypothetical protein